MLKLIKNLNDKLQLPIKIIGTIVFFIPMIFGAVKFCKPYVISISRIPHIDSTVTELRNSLYVLTGVVASELNGNDSTEYTVIWKGKEITARLKPTESGNVYVFLPDNAVGERTFIANYNYDTKKYYFADFKGNMITLKEK